MMGYFPTTVPKVSQHRAGYAQGFRSLEHTHDACTKHLRVSVERQPMEAIPS
jgi:hypothetical protein